MDFNPYNNNNLKFPLSIKELKMLDETWKFLTDFRETKLTRKKYKIYMTQKIKNEYNIKEFYILEKNAEKLYWNLVAKIKKDFHLKSEIFLKENLDLNETKNKILMRNNKIKESTVEKTFIFVKNNKLLYKYKYPDDLDLIVSSIMINRSVYETIMSEENDIFSIEIEPYNNIIEFDYLFPNLNTIKSFTQTKKERMNNIYKMFYK